MNCTCWWFHYPGLLLHTELMVSLFIRCTMRCEIWAQPVGRAPCLEYRVSWVPNPTRGSSIFPGKVTALGVLCCFALFVCLTLPASFFQLSFSIYILTLGTRARIPISCAHAHYVASAPVPGLPADPDPRSARVYAETFVIHVYSTAQKKNSTVVFFLPPLSDAHAHEEKCG